MDGAREARPSAVSALDNGYAHEAWPSAVSALDNGCLVETFSLLTDAGLCRARLVCQTWRDASTTEGLWRSIFARMYGEHSARWAHLHEPVKAAVGDDEWRLRCEIRRRAADGRRLGIVTHSKIELECAQPPLPVTESPFYPTCMAMDGPWLAIGEGGGRTSLYDMRTGKRCWQGAQVLPAQVLPTPTLNVELSRKILTPWEALEFDEDGPRVVTSVCVCAVGGVVASMASISESVLVRSLATGALLSRIDVATCLCATYSGEPPFSAGYTLEGMCIYAPSRLGPEARGLGEMRLMTVGSYVVDPAMAPFTAAKFNSMLWLLPTDAPPPSERPRAPSPTPLPRLLRWRCGPMSEQAGVLAELYVAPESARDLHLHEILLIELLTLSPIGKAVLTRPRMAKNGYAAVCPQRGCITHYTMEPHAMSVQRRTNTSWTLVLDFPQSATIPVTATSGSFGSVIEVWSLVAPKSAEDLRLAAGEGPPPTQPENASETLTDAPELQANLLQVIPMMPSDGGICKLPLSLITSPGGGSQRLFAKPDWPTFDRHRSPWLFCHRPPSQDHEQEPCLLNLETAKYVHAADIFRSRAKMSSATGHLWNRPKNDACVDLRLSWGCSVGSDDEPCPLILTTHRHTDGSQPPATHEQQVAAGHAQRFRIACWKMRPADSHVDCTMDEHVLDHSGPLPHEQGNFERTVLRGMPANAQLRQLAGGELQDMWFVHSVLPHTDGDDTEPQFETASNWRWLVVVDATGVHILDFLLPPRTKKRLRRAQGDAATSGSGG